MESMRSRAVLAGFALVAAELARRVLAHLLGADSSASGTLEVALPFAAAWFAATLLLGDREPLLPGPSTPRLLPRVFVRIVAASALVGGYSLLHELVEAVSTSGANLSGHAGAKASWIAYRFAIGAALGGTASIELFAARRWARSWRRDLLAPLAAGGLAFGLLFLAACSGQYCGYVTITGSPVAAANALGRWVARHGVYEDDLRPVLAAIAATTVLLRLRGASLDVTIGGAALVGLVVTGAKITPEVGSTWAPGSSYFSHHIDSVRELFGDLLLAPVLLPLASALADKIDALLGDALRAEDEPAPRVEPVPATAPATSASFVLLGGTLLALVGGATLARVASWAPRCERQVTIEHTLAVAFVGTAVAVAILGLAFVRRDRWPAAARLEGRASVVGALLGSAGVGFFAGLVGRIAATTDPNYQYLPSRGALAFGSGAPAFAIAGALVALGVGAKTFGEVLAFVAIGLGGIELGLLAANGSYATVLFAVSPSGEDALVIFGAGAALAVAGALAVTRHLDGART